jgi:aminoglycoside phosphotransferase (APT) family kinase protein
VNAAVVEFLKKAGLGEPSAMQALSGGVSSDIWRVDLASGRACVKRALSRLRVAQVWEAPIERNRYERLWMQTAAAAAPGAAPKVLAWDDERGLFAMEYLDFPVWKSLLRSGRTDAAFAARVGAALAAIHSATAGRPEIASAFPTDAIFHAIRLEPYLLATARQHPDLDDRLSALAGRTAAAKRCLVHGDVSPKNILVTPRGPVFLDAECAWYGDPAFDLAFVLNHLLLKGAWQPQWRARYVAAFAVLTAAYLAHVEWESPAACEARAAALLPALMLARIDGKSPVEYLTRGAQKDAVRAFAGPLIVEPVSTVGEIARRWQAAGSA